MTDEQTIEHALEIAQAAHAGQKDRYGVPYILHPLRVALAGSNTLEIASGFLHDVVEDSDAWTLERLREEGFSEDLVRVVDCLTKRDGEAWDDYIGRVKTDRTAMRVKLNDLGHNMDASRIPEFQDKEYERFQRYVRAWNDISEALRDPG
jgi:(p)ppGpp synthase/HD superfamily hydrolase